MTIVAGSISLMAPSGRMTRFPTMRNAGPSSSVTVITGYGANGAYAGRSGRMADHEGPDRSEAGHPLPVAPGRLAVGAHGAWRKPQDPTGAAGLEPQLPDGGTRPESLGLLVGARCEEPFSADRHRHFPSLDQDEPRRPARPAQVEPRTMMNEFPHTPIPQHGLAREEVLAQLLAMKQDDQDWRGRPRVQPGLLRRRRGARTPPRCALALQCRKRAQCAGLSEHRPHATRHRAEHGHAARGR